jgi:hypothetical protein
MKIKVLFLLVVTTLNAIGATMDIAQIDQLTGLKGKLNERKTPTKSSFTREDIAVSVDGWKIPAFMGLSAWAECEVRNVGFCYNVCSNPVTISIQIS